jgi:type I restriction enzyme S subunit
VTKTGGRSATLRHIMGDMALAVGRPASAPPPGWKWVALTEVARLESGHTPSRKHKEYWGGNVPWLSIRDAKAHHGGTIHETIEQTNELGIANSSARVLPAGTVCLSRTASVGYVVVMGRPMATSQDFVNWVCSKHLEPRFLQHLLIAEGPSLSRFSSGAVHQTIYFPEAKAFHVCLPPIEEQRRIVAVLNEAFTAIAVATDQAERNLANSQEIFEAELDILVEAARAAFPGQPLAHHCRRVTVGHVGPMKDRYQSDGIPFLRSQNIRPFEIDLAGVTFIDRAFDAELAKSRLLPGDIAVVRTGYPGTAAVIPGSLEASNCADLVIIRPGSDLNPHYLVAFLNSNLGKRMIAGNLVGAAQKHFNVGSAKRVPVPLPSLAEQARFVERVEDLRQMSIELEQNYRQKLAMLGALKQSLLYRAFSGNLIDRQPLAA